MEAQQPLAVVWRGLTGVAQLQCRDAHDGHKPVQLVPLVPHEVEVPVGS